MKKERMARYVGLEARSAPELADKLTKKIEELKDREPEVIWNLGNGNSAFLLYYDTEEIPETIQEEYLLRGECYTCADCPHKEPVTDGRRRYKYTCKRKVPGTNPEDQACKWFYIEKEEGRA